MLLQVNGVSKRFGGLPALDGVTFDQAEGRITGLIGPNGAGKTTLFNVISGVYRPDSGSIHFRGRSIAGLPPHRVAQAGIARTHQIVRPLSELTVRENVMAGACFGREGHSIATAGRIAAGVLERVGLADHAGLPAASLNLPQKKRLELARALAARPFLLLLDEVLAGLNPSEVSAMMDLIAQLSAEGLAILMVEHLMQAVMTLSDHVLVLDYGRLIAAGKPEEVSAQPQVIEAYLGDPRLVQSLLGSEAGGAR